MVADVKIRIRVCPLRPGPQVLAKIKELSLTTDTSAAGRLSARLKRKGDARPFHQRYPLYGCVHPPGCPQPPLLQPRSRRPLPLRTSAASL